MARRSKPRLIDDRNRIALTKTAMKALNVKPGDLLEIEIEDNVVRLHKLRFRRDDNPETEQLDSCPTCHRQRGELPGVFTLPDALNPLPGMTSKMVCWDSFHDEVPDADVP